MNNLYNLVKNFDFYLEAFRNIESNKTFVYNSEGIMNELAKFFDLLITQREIVELDADFKNAKNKIERNYFSFLEVLEKFGDDKVFYDQTNAHFSIDLKKQDIKELKKLFKELLENITKESINELINFVEEKIKSKLFTVSINYETTKKDFSIYDIVFSNLQSQTNSPENSEEKGLINKNFKIIFGVILGFIKEKGIDFDQSIFHFSGTTEGEKDKDTNRRLKAYHMAHKGFLKMKYNEIDEEEIINAFKNNKVHPFLYRINKDAMYISVSKDVDLTEVFNGEDEDEINDDLRNDMWLEFVSDYLNSSEGLEEVEKITIELLENRIPSMKKFIEILFPLPIIWYNLIIHFNQVIRDINDLVDELKNIAQHANDKGISIEDFNDNEELINEIKKIFENKNIINLIKEIPYNIPKAYSLLKEVEKSVVNDIKNIDNSIEIIIIQANNKVEEDFVENNYDAFINGEYDEWIEENME